MSFISLLEWNSGPDTSNQDAMTSINLQALPSRQSESWLAPAEVDRAIAFQALFHYLMAQVSFHIMQAFIGRHFYTYIFSLKIHSGVDHKSHSSDSGVDRK